MASKEYQPIEVRIPRSNPAEVGGLAASIIGMDRVNPWSFLSVEGKPSCVVYVNREGFAGDTNAFVVIEDMRDVFSITCAPWIERELVEKIKAEFQEAFGLVE